ncbi:glycosyltransferase family 2 protein [Clostridium algidicarnis]|uniref:glycosyltransferase family A protein n=1 Tax=Clostridium algidicarnis TaxID=37659 RepID=UPI001C0DBBFB|nr:glycosyltransferase family A protein [Clostridium algidicarnis]MBU3207627.1 glycosyltransferase family 2 protein [Clostridium algidicarnis]
MVKFFYNIQTWFMKRNISILTKITYRINLFLARVLVPIYYSLTPTKKSGVNKGIKEPKVIVSLTSFPPRMNMIWMVLESLLRQTRKPDKIILWLADSQIKSKDDIDNRVLKMYDRGLEIRFCEDLKSHKKYYYTMKYFKEDIVITVDDDLFYPENMIEKMLDKHYQYPNNIICYRAHKITFKDNSVDKYLNWDYASPNLTGPDELLIPTGGAGALYPPKSLNEEVFNINSIKSLCPNADDIWLKCMGFMNGTKVVKVYPLYSEMFSVFNSDKDGLAKSNVIGGENDIQFKNIIDHYSIKFIKKE